MWSMHICQCKLPTHVCLLYDGNQSNISKSIIGQASDSIINSESFFILKGRDGVVIDMRKYGEVCFTFCQKFIIFVLTKCTSCHKYGTEWESLDFQFAYTMTSLNNNKIHLKIFNYHIKICKIVRNYDIPQFMIL